MSQTEQHTRDFISDLQQVFCFMQERDSGDDFDGVQLMRNAALASGKISGEMEEAIKTELTEEQQLFITVRALRSKTGLSWQEFSGFMCSCKDDKIKMLLRDIAVLQKENQMLREQIQENESK